MFFKNIYRERLLALLPSFVGIALLAAFYWDVLTSKLVISHRDMLFVYLPTRMHFAARLLNGEFPEWYPFDGLGSSYVGNVVTAILHPSVLLHLFLPHTLALNLSVVLAHSLAALGAFLLIRQWNCGRTAALIGSLAFSCSGYLMSMDGNLPYLLAAATIPWAVLGIERLSVPITGAAMALIALSGDPQALYFTSLFLLACAIARHTPSASNSSVDGGASRWPAAVKTFFADRTRQKAMLVLLASGLLALLASAAQLLPAIFATEARNSGEAALRANRIWSLNPLRLFELWSPGFMRLPDGKTPVRLFSQETFDSFWADSLYVGAAVLALAVVALRFSKQRRTCVLLAALGTFTLMVALGAGPNAPVYELLQHLLPGFSLLRYPEKTFVFVAFAAAMLAGLGAEALLQARLDTIKRYLTRVLLFSALLLFVLSAALPSMENFLLILAGPVGELDKAREEWHQLLPAFQENLLIGALLAFFSFTLILAIRRQKPLVTKFLLLGSAILPFFCSVQQFRIYWSDSSLTFKPPKIFDQKIEIPNYGQTRLYTDPVYDDRNLMEQYKKKSQGIKKRKGIIFLDRGVGAYFNIENAAGYLPLTAQGRQAKALEHIPDLQWFFGFNVRFAQKLNPDPNVTDIEDALVLVEDPRAGDRIRLVQGIPVASTEEAIAVANRPDFDAVNVVPVETGNADFPTEAPRASKLEVVTYSPEYIDITAASETATTLFIADAFADGWRATLDGEEVPIFPGLIAGRAIALPAGAHRVELTYRTPGLRVGLCLSVVGWAAIAALALRGRRRRRDASSLETLPA